MNTMIVALRYLQQRKLRTLLTTLAILFGVAVIYGTNAMFPAMQTALEQAALAGENTRVKLNRGFGFEARPFDAVTDTAALLEIAGVEAVAGRVHQLTSLDIIYSGMSGMITGVDPALESPDFFTMASGRFIQPGDERVTVVSTFIATVVEVSVGDTLNLLGEDMPYEVIGILDTTVADADIYIPLAEAQEYFNLEGQVDQFILTLSNEVPVMTIVAGLDQAFGPTGYSFEGGVSLSNATLSNSVTAMVFNVFAALALFVGALLIYISLTTAVVERKRDLAMLRAIGAERKQISRLITAEAVVQGILGSAAGIIVGQILALVLLQILWTTTYRNFAVPTVIPLHLPSMLIAVTVGLFTSVFAAYIPARVASRVSPLEALRPSQDITMRRVALIRIAAGVIALAAAVIVVASQSSASGLGALGFLMGGVLLVPVLVAPLMRLMMPLISRLFPRVADLIRASALRQPWRTASTVNLMTIGFAVFTGVAVLLGPIMESNERMVNSQSPDADLALQSTESPSTIDTSLVDRLRDLPNIARITTLSISGAEINGVEMGIQGLDASLGTRMRNYSVIEDNDGILISRFQEEADAAVRELGETRSAFITFAASTRTGLEVGDTFTLQTATGEHTYTITALTFAFSQQYGEMLVMIDHRPEDFPDAQISEVIVGFEDRSLSAETYAEINNTILVDYPTLLPWDVAAERQRMISDAQRGMSIFYMLAALVLIPSVIGLLNTLVMNVMERTREIGLLRATGADRDQVRGTVIGEGLLLGLLSAVIGILIGVGMGYSLLTAMSSINAQAQATPFAFSIPVGSFALGIIAAVILILLATLLPARRAARLNILEALRYE